MSDWIVAGQVNELSSLFAAAAPPPAPAGPPAPPPAPAGPPAPPEKSE